METSIFDRLREKIREHESQAEYHKGRIEFLAKIMEDPELREEFKEAVNPAETQNTGRQERSLPPLTSYQKSVLAAVKTFLAEDTEHAFDSQMIFAALKRRGVHLEAKHQNSKGLGKLLKAFYLRKELDRTADRGYYLPGT